MKQNEIKIFVGGYTATGKSTISELIGIALKKEGFNIEIKNIDDVMMESGDGDGENQARTREMMNEAIPNIVSKTKKIIIEETQFKRPLITDNI